MGQEGQRTERVQFLRNMALLAAREVTDVIRAKLGLLKPVNLDFSDLTPPDTRMAKDAEEFARDTHTQDLLSHGYRTYYFGAMIAAYRQQAQIRQGGGFQCHDFARYRPYRAETYSANAMLLRRERWSSSSRFFPQQRSPGRKAQIVRDAISAHLNLHLPVRKYGEVPSLVAKGAVCDLFGFEKRRLPEKFKSDLLRAHRAGDLQAALLSNEQMAPGSRLDIGRKLFGGLPERIWIHDIK
jgi:hypothetical protein